MVAVPAKHNIKVITVLVEDKHVIHKPKIPKRNKFITFLYVTLIKRFSMRLPEGKRSVGFRRPDNDGCPLHAIKAQRWRRGIAPLSLILGAMEVSGQRHAPVVLSPGRNPDVH